MQKATLKNWYVERSPSGNSVLYGEAHGHPQFADGTPVRTSKLKSIDFEKGEAVTQNTIYTLEQA